MGEVLTVREADVWPIGLAWMRFVLKDGPMTRRAIAVAAGRNKSSVDGLVRDAVDLGLVRSYRDRDTLGRGGVHLVALVHGGRG